MKIYGDTNSGNCLKVKWVCDNLALPYTWIAVDTLKRETRTAEFLKLNSAGQVPAVEFDDGRTLAQSNAIIRYLARGSDLIPADAFAAAKMDEWLFWEQYSHEPYIAVCRFQMFYLGKPASDLDPDKVKRGYAALARMEQQLAATRFLVGDTASLADVSLLAYTRVAHEGGFHLDGYAAVRRWIGETETIARPVAGALKLSETLMAQFRRSPSAAPAATMSASSSRCWRTIRSAARASGSKIRCRSPIFEAFESVDRDPNIQLVVAEDGEGAVVGCLQLCILPGLSSQGASRGLIEDVRVASHCRSRGIGEQLVRWAVARGARQGVQAGRTADPPHPRRCAAVL